jgi:hypothetical protein
MPNPFDDLIPVGDTSQGTDPFADLIPTSSQSSIGADDGEISGSGEGTSRPLGFLPTGQELDDWNRGQAAGFRNLGRKIDLFVRDIGASLGLASPQSTADRRAEIKDLQESERDAAKNKAIFTAGSLLTEIGTEAATLAGGAGALGLVGRGAKALAGDVGAGALAGALQDPGEEGSRTQQAAIGGALGGGIGVALRGAGSLVRGSKDATQKAAEISRQVPKELQSKVPLSVGQLTDRPLINRFEQFSRAVPGVGTGKFFNRQASQLQGAIDDFVTEITPFGS